MGAADGAAGALLGLLDAGLEGLGWGIAGRVGGRAHAVVVARRCRWRRASDVDIAAEVRGDRVAQVLHVVDPGQLCAWRHGHALSRRRSGERRIVVGCLLARRLRLAPSSRGHGRIRALGQGLGACTCRIFDGADVLILVPGQGGAASEGLLAVGIRASIGSLAGVNAAMASKRAAITEGLCTRLSVGPGLLGLAGIGACVPCYTAHSGAASRQCAHANGLSEQTVG